MEIKGTYGSEQTPCTVFVIGDWYAVEGSKNVNRAPSGFFEHLNIEKPLNVELIHDVDTFHCRLPIESLEELAIEVA